MKFIKLLFSGFETQLNLPAHFCSRVRDDFARKGVVETCLGKWKVKVGNESGIFYLYGEEWVRFVKCHQLDEGSVLAFQHHGSFRFHVSVYDTSACQKLEFPTTNIDETRSSQCSRNPTFTRTLNTSSGYNPLKKTTIGLYLPTKIWRSNNLQEKREVIIRLSELETKEWWAKLTFYPGRSGGQDRMMVGAGWSKFVSYNDLRKGQKCTFEIITNASKYGYPNHAIIIVVTKGH